jgi:hypothetical protein
LPKLRESFFNIFIIISSYANKVARSSKVK